MFIAPRYHTNQIPIVSGLISEGHEISFLVSHIGSIEDHSDIIPMLIKPSLTTRILYKNINKKHGKIVANDWIIRKFKPSFFSLLKTMYQIKPDILILRERSRLSLIAYIISKLLRIKASLLYNQAPLNEKLNLGTLKKLLLPILFPKVRYTPVKFLPNDSNFNIKKHTYYLPFCQNLATLLRVHMFKNRINILMVGKFRPYKNILFLIDVASKMKQIDKVFFTLLGQVSNSGEVEYMNEVVERINSNNLGKYFEIKYNIDHNEMGKIYSTQDIFILPSQNEYASISILEAMSFGCCTLSSVNNGTAFCVIEGQCGYTFDPTDPDYLSKLLDDLVSKPDLVLELGNNGRRYIEEEFSFNRFYLEFSKMIKKEFNLKCNG